MKQSWHYLQADILLTPCLSSLLMPADGGFIKQNLTSHMKDSYEVSQP